MLLGFFAFAGSSVAPAATLADLAIANLIRQTDPTLVSEKIVYRNEVSSDLDLVIAIASTAEWSAGSDSTYLWWDENRKLGLFLQDKAHADRIYLLSLAAGPQDCGARIERATSTDTVISCMGEKGYQGMNQKFVYDIRAKALISHFAYQPFAIMRAFNDSSRSVFVGIDMARLVAVEFQPGESPEFRILTNSGAAPWVARVGTHQGTEGVEQRQTLYLVPENPAPIRFGKAEMFTFTGGSIVDSHGKQYPLPQSTYDDFAKARPKRAKDGYVREGTTIEETIGSVQPEGDKLLFGKTFYDGEGNSGLGGFGYFDATDRQYHLFALPEVVDFSISPILVKPDAIWMGAYWACEYGCPPGTILRYDRRGQTMRRYDLPDVVNGFVASGDRLLAYTNFGFAVIEGDQTRRYFIDRTADGRLRMAEATR